MIWNRAIGVQAALAAQVQNNDTQPVKLGNVTYRYYNKLFAKLANSLRSPFSKVICAYKS